MHVARVDLPHQLNYLVAVRQTGASYLKVSMSFIADKLQLLGPSVVMALSDQPMSCDSDRLRDARAEQRLPHGFCSFQALVCSRASARANQRQPDTVSVILRPQFFVVPVSAHEIVFVH